jgi:membrane protein required for beta-lactamase induction
MVTKSKIRFWLALILLIISLAVLAWTFWPVAYNQQTLPLPTVVAPISMLPALPVGGV